MTTQKRIAATTVASKKPSFQSISFSSFSESDGKSRHFQRKLLNVAPGPHWKLIIPLLTVARNNLVCAVTMSVKTFAFLGLSVLTLVGCNSHKDTPMDPEPGKGEASSHAAGPESPQTNPEATVAVTLGEMAPQEALKVDIEGCGTALRAANAAQAGEKNYVWFDDYSKAVVIIDTQKVLLTNARAGQKDAALAGQYQNADGTISIEQRLRQKGEFQGEVVEIEGDLAVSTPDGKTVIAVLGSSGC